MKVLHLPANISSQMRATVHVLREIGIEARGMTGPSLYQNSGGLEILPRADGGSLLARKSCAARRAAAILKAVAWADAVHWHGETALPLAADLLLARTLNRRRFVEFWGSDIRDPEIEIPDNPHFARAWESGGYECRTMESRAHSRAVQRRFQAGGARLFNVSPGMAQYLVPGSFPMRCESGQRLLLEEYPPAVPSAAAARPLVVHAPSAPGAKGTPFVLAAVERLREEVDFGFQLIQGMPAATARDWISRCDIFVDQLILGEYGVAAVEAMALGKPVICYLKPSLRPHTPPHCPVISADPDTITEVLREWLRDGPRRRSAGEASRAWVEERHDARRIVPRMAEYYQAA